METLASWHGGPGPWILFLPLIWAAVVFTAVTVARRAGWRRHGWPPRDPRAQRVTGDAPIAVLGRRFAAGEIDEDEYWRRLSVLEEHFGGKGGAAG